MSDIVERLRELEAVESELACECDCPPEATANYRYAKTCEQAADEITRLRAEVERLGRDYNTARDAHDKLLAENERFKLSLTDTVRQTQEQADEITRLRNELHIAQEWSAKVMAGRERDVDEITRLHAEVERLEEDKQAIRYCNDTQAGVIDALRARVEKLEGALKRIANEPRDIDKSDWELFAEVCNEARAALGDTHE